MCKFSILVNVNTMSYIYYSDGLSYSGGWVIPKHPNRLYQDVRWSENEKGIGNPNMCDIIPKVR